MAKVKIPKRIAGVKVPKKLRKQAKKLLKASASPLVTDLALAGLGIAANRMLDGAAGKRRHGAGAERPAKGGLDGLNLAALLEAAAAEGARRFLEGYRGDAPARKAAPKPAPRRRPGAAAQT